MKSIDKYIKQYNIKIPCSTDAYNANPMLGSINCSLGNLFYGVISDLFNKMRSMGYIDSDVGNERIFLGNTFNSIFSNLIRLDFFDPLEYKFISSGSIFFGLECMFNYYKCNYELYDISLEYINSPEHLPLSKNEKYVYIHTCLEPQITDYEIDIFKKVKAANKDNIILLDTTLCKYKNFKSYIEYIDIDMYSCKDGKYMSLGFGGIVEIYNDRLLKKFKSMYRGLRENHIDKLNFEYLYMPSILYMHSQLDNFITGFHTIINKLYVLTEAKSCSGFMFIKKDILKKYNLETHAHIFKPIFYDKKDYTNLPNTKKINDEYLTLLVIGGSYIHNDIIKMFLKNYK